MSDLEGAVVLNEDDCLVCAGTGSVDPIERETGPNPLCPSCDGSGK